MANGGERGVQWAGGPVRPTVDTILFDMDGVLVDVADSYRRAIRETVKEFTDREVTPELIQAFKNRGGYNDDWRLTAALIAETGAEVPFDRVVEAFQGRYRGTDFDGFIADEPALVRSETLEALAGAVPLGLVTGRPEAEARWTLRRCGWETFFQVVVAMEHQKGRGKPDPFPLALAMAQLGKDLGRGNAAYVGDTVDDMRAAVAAQMFAIGVVPPGQADTPLRDHLLQAGATLVLADVNLLPGSVALPADRG